LKILNGTIINLTVAGQRRIRTGLLRVLVNFFFSLQETYSINNTPWDDLQNFTHHPAG